VGAAVALVAGVVPLRELVELVNIGTLFAFVIVSAGVIVLRRTEPGMARPFRCPWVPWVPLASIAACAYLMASLPAATWLRFGLWLALGLLVYGSYSRRRSSLSAITP
jgi:APA family basic amino acid/polyamine antiporter